MNHRLLASLLSICAAACGGASSSSATTSTPASAPPPSKSSSDQPCGYDIIASAKDKGGACLEPAVLGADKTTRCEAFLQQNGWQRDGVAEAAIGQRTGKTIVCFRAPGATEP